MSHLCQEWTAMTASLPAWCHSSTPKPHLRTLLPPAKVGETPTESSACTRFFIFNTRTSNHSWTLIWDFILTKAYFCGLKTAGQKSHLDHPTAIFLHPSKYPAMKLCNCFRSSSGSLKDFSGSPTKPFVPCAQQIIPCPSSQWVWKNWIVFLNVKIAYVCVDVLRPTFSRLLHLRIFHIGFMGAASFCPQAFWSRLFHRAIMMLITPKWLSQFSHLYRHQLGWE